LKIGVFTLILMSFSAATNPGPKANEEARVAADAAATKPCLKKKQDQ